MTEVLKAANDECFKRWGPRTSVWLGGAGLLMGLGALLWIQIDAHPERWPTGTRAMSAEFACWPERHNLRRHLDHETGGFCLVPIT